MISETKSNESFSAMKFNIEGHIFFRSDRNANGGDILLYVHDDIPCKLIRMSNSTVEVSFKELKLRKKKISLKNSAFLIRVPTCYRNLSNPTRVDFMLTNSNWSFQNFCATETELPDFYKMIVTVLKIYFQKREAKIINYRNY